MFENIVKSCITVVSIFPQVFAIEGHLLFSEGEPRSSRQTTCINIMLKRNCFQMHTNVKINPQIDLLGVTVSEDFQ